VNFISKLFSKSPSDLLAKGDKCLESDSFFDARTYYEDGLQRCADGELVAVFNERIATANLRLAERNLFEAEFAHSHGDFVKAIDHLELAKTLTSDPVIRDKADLLLRVYAEKDEHQEEPQVAASSCNSCSSSSGCAPSGSENSDHSLPLLEYYELLIQQLPAEQCQRYAGLGEDFASAFIAASQDDHQDALAALERCSERIPRDIYCYEKGKLLHRLGHDRESEQQLRTAIQLNGGNALAWLNLALVLREGNRFQDAITVIEAMVSGDIMAGEALLMRADIVAVTGDHESAVNLYVELLQTSYARPAAEKLYGILQELGRPDDAAIIFKKYLNKSCH
jgi:tetratricopeptide (TPR) repeat protein